jgi:two-component system KDP operon response regulator KdpE
MKALIIDGEPQIRRALRVTLEPNGYAVFFAASGEEGLDAAAVHSPDITLLDLTLPDIDGLEVCRFLREWSDMPILVVSARDATGDKVAALDQGADDFVTKPFNMDELLARMRAVLRRQFSRQRWEESRIRAGDLQIDLVRRKVSVAGRDVHLTPTEYELLRCLAKHDDCTLTHRQLLTKVWGTRYFGDTHTLRVHMANLRNKIEPEPTCPRYSEELLFFGELQESDMSSPIRGRLGWLGGCSRARWSGVSSSRRASSSWGR